MNMFWIALVNTVFRVTTVAILAPFIPLIEKLMTAVIRTNPAEEEETGDMKRLEERFLKYPTLAVEQTSLTIGKMASLTQKALNTAMNLLTEYSDKGVETVRNLEDVVDRYEDKIGS